MKWILILIFLTYLTTSGAYGYFSSVVTAQGTINVVSDLEPPSLKLLISNLEITERIENGSFETGLGNWFTFGEVTVIEADALTPLITIQPHSGGKMARIGSPSSATGSHRLSLAFPKARNLKLSYLLATTDHLPFDQPAFLVRINGQTLYQTEVSEANPANFIDSSIRIATWRELVLDLTEFGTDYLTLELIVNNSGNSERPTWVYVDEISTDLAAVNSTNEFQIVADDPSGISQLEYRLDGNDWQSGNIFFITNSGEHIASVRATDNLGNSKEISEAVFVDNNPPEMTNDLLIDWQGSNYVDLSWTPKSIDDKYLRSWLYLQRNCSISSDFVLANSRRILDILLNGKPDRTEWSRIYGLNPDTNYCFAIVSQDAAGNQGPLSNIALVKTSTSNATIIPGDLVINELMWMGSSIHTDDEWIELRNLTDRSLDLSSLTFTRKTSTGETSMVIEDLSGKVISPFNYFLIADKDIYPLGDSQLNVVPNIFDNSLLLSNSNLQIKMFNQGTFLDSAGTGGLPPAGIYISTQSQRFSMQRSFGFSQIQELNWFTTLDPTTSQTYFDFGALERGTPGAGNH